MDIIYRGKCTYLLGARWNPISLDGGLDTVQRDIDGVDVVAQAREYVLLMEARHIYKQGLLDGIRLHRQVSCASI